ncbi:chromatin assembly factor 1 subunit A isoform X1 [Pelobates fuscus]|uniref:chromatin assembly factor 1 subunit A isoform X1 n=2 Tax=Pelobates fuscus TaxID=191477 RepID=UPI002FE4C50B
MPGKGGPGAVTDRKTSSPAVMKSSSRAASKKMVQARLPFKRLNPALKEKDELLEGKKVKKTQKDSPPTSLHLSDTSTEDLENNCDAETEAVHQFPKAINGKGPLDNYLKKTLKVSLGQSPITIDLTEDSNSGVNEQSCIVEESRTLLANGSTPQNNPSSPTPSTQTEKCNVSVNALEQGESNELPGTLTVLSPPVDLQESPDSQYIKMESPDKDATNLSSKSSSKEVSDSSEEDDSPIPSSNCSPVSASSSETQASPQEKNLSPRELKSPSHEVILQKGTTEKKIKDKEKPERKRKLQAERKERERAREEAKAAKERVKEEAKKKRDEEREQREKEKQEKKEKEDKEKAEKLRIKEEKKKEKLEALEAKQEEKRKKEEEKRVKEEEKRMKAEKAEIRRFFHKPKIQHTPKTFASSCGKFAPFEIKKNMAVAPLCRVAFELEASEQLDKFLQDQNSKLSFLSEIKTRKPRRMGRTLVPQVSVLSSDMMESEVDEVQVLEDPKVVLDGKFMHESLVNQNPVPERRKFGRMKLLQFCDNYRPAYWGTWNRMSSDISARKPLAQDKKLLDYEVDSDEEWEEEEPGESLSHSEGDDDDEPKEDEEDDDGFFVPHGYLSEDERGASDEDHRDPENQKVQQRLKAKEWDELQTKGKRIRVLQPVVIGCIWQGSSAAEIRRLLRFSVCVLESPPAEEDLAKENSCRRNSKDRQILSQLLPLLHGNVNGSKTIIHEFQEYCRQGLFSEGETSSTSVGVTSNLNSPNTAQQTPNITVPSKACLKRLISENSVYEKRPDHRMCWYVHSEVLKTFEQENLPVPCQWTYITQNYSSQEDCGVSAGSVHSTPVSSKRKSAGSMPITKFMKKAKETVDVMETDGFQADTEEEDDEDCMIVDEQESKDVATSTLLNSEITRDDGAVPASCQA